MPTAQPILRLKNDAEKIRKLITVLRGPHGCAWDRRQTAESLAPLLIEEAHEAVEAIERRRIAATGEELGDLLFLLLSIVHACESRGRLTYRDLVRDTAAKYISRHPHVFKSRRRMAPDQILVQWETMKAARRGRHPIESVPVHLPALYQAKRIYEKAARLKLVRKRRSARRLSARAIGRRLLALALAAAQRGIDPERALRGEVRKLRSKLISPKARGAPRPST